MPQNRRTFARNLGFATAVAANSLWLARAGNEKQYKAAIIGRTGGGDYGHGFELLFESMENVSVEAVADRNAEGLKKAAARSGAKRTYLDFKEMLIKERPEIVSIGPRQPDCHREMALAALDVGAHLIVEKPFTEHLEEADELVAAAARRGRKITVGHKNRYTEDFQRMKRLIAEGFFGTVLEMRVQGKQDTRVGGEDLMVLGTHDFDAMRFFFGDPIRCSASVTTQGQPISKADIRKGREPMLVAGDTIHAQFHFAKNVLCSWHSIKAEESWHTAPAGTERWGFHIFGTRRILAHYSRSGPFYLDSPFLGHATQKAEWKPLPDPKGWPPPAHETHLVRDLLHAIQHEHEPLCSGADGRWAVEMVSAVYESQRRGTPVSFPLQDRTNPLTRF